MLEKILRFSKRPVLKSPIRRCFNSLAGSQNEQMSKLETSHDIIEPFHSKMSYRVSDNLGLHLLYETFGNRLDVLARVKPNDECFIFPYSETRLTFLELKQKCEEFAQNLLNLGFQKGDRLAVMLPNIPEINISVLAAASIGVIVVLMNPSYQQVEIEFMLKKTNAKGVVILDNTSNYRHYDILTRICPELTHSLKGGLVSKSLPDLKHVIVANLMHKYGHLPGINYKGTWSFGELDSYGLSPIQKPKVEPEDPFALLFTSGTTGIPKAAVLTQFSLQNTLHISSSVLGSEESFQNICCPIPMFHVFGLILGCLSPLIKANKVVVPNYFPDSLATIKSIDKEKCTALNGAPVIFTDILTHLKRNQYDLSSLEILIIGASTVQKKLVQRLKDELNVKHLIIGYGMTESSSAGTVTRSSDENSEKHAYESIGTPYPFTECKVVDASTGCVVPHGVDGELYMRGYHIMKGYWDEPVRTAETIDSNGWLKTGDIVSMDNDGYLYFKSRAKEVVIRGGINIYPAEIETFLLSNDAFCNVQVFGYPDERNGEELCAWIKLKEGVSGLSPADIYDFCKDKIAHFKIPKYVKFVNAVPVNVTGKVQKDKMRTQMLNDLENLPVENLFKIK